MSGCDFLQVGRGDELMVYTPDAVKTIGLWDERYTGIVIQEGDYFTRARLCLPARACIHDEIHHRFLNTVEGWPTMTEDVLELGA